MKHSTSNTLVGWSVSSHRLPPMTVEIIPTTIRLTTMTRPMWELFGLSTYTGLDRMVTDAWRPCYLIIDRAKVRRTVNELARCYKATDKFLRGFLSLMPLPEERTLST